MTNTTTLPSNRARAAERALALVGREARRHRTRGLGAARVFKRAMRSARLGDSEWAILLMYLLELESKPVVNLKPIHGCSITGTSS